jgi:hypothetical protein
MILEAKYVILVKLDFQCLAYENEWGEGKRIATKLSLTNERIAD